jgi:hypothetical protein
MATTDYPNDIADIYWPDAVERRIQGAGETPEGPRVREDADHVGDDTEMVDEVDDGR